MHVIMTGTARTGTLETIKMRQYAESIGADGVQLVLLYYHIPEEEGMYQHYKELAESIDIGIMIYNNPEASGSWIKPALIAKLSKIPNIIVVKENTHDIGAYYAIQRAVDPKDASILCGLGEQMFSFEALYGCPSFISSVANFTPNLAYSVYAAAAARNFDKLTEIVGSMAPRTNFEG